MQKTETADDFIAKFSGRFTSALRWPQLDDLWATVHASPGGWYIYAVGEVPPVVPASEEKLKHFLREVDELLHREHEEDYCGIVYADDFTHPGMIKIYDPNNLGVVCGFSENPPLPGWVLSRIQPVDLAGRQPSPANRRHWWQRMFSA